MPSKPTYNELISQNRELDREVNENKQAIAKLETEQLFSEKVLSSMPGIFYLYDESGTLIRWNKNHETLTGFSADELPKRAIFDWFSGADKDLVKNAVDEVFNKGKADLEAHLVVKNGDKIPYYFTGIRMVVDRKKYLLGMGLDLTEQKNTELELRKSEEKYRAIFENAVEGIYQTTPDGRFASANPAMARLLGYSSPEELMETVQDITKRLYVSRKVRDNFLRLIETQKEVSGFEAQFNCKDGNRIWVSIHARQVLDQKGKLILIEGIITDITEIKIQRDNLRKSEAMLREENLRLKSNIKDRYRFGNIIGKSRSMQDVYELILKASATNANVIIYGESGTGKELVAKAIHDFSDRKNGRFVPVNCGAIPENLLESEFFGYKKGAFTGASTDKKGFLDMAEGGTLFLDELGEITPNLQVKLLRVIEGGGFTPVGGKEHKKPDIRIIAATNQNLQRKVRKGKMREDFFYRIHIIPITLPPLRDRNEDIPLIVDHFLKQMTEGEPIPILNGEMLEILYRHSWPGNVRELQNVIQRYVSMGHFDLIDKTGKPTSALKSDATLSVIPDGKTYSDAMDTFEKQLLVKSLADCRWNREKAALKLDIPIRTFYRKLKKFGLKRHDMPNMA